MREIRFRVWHRGEQQMYQPQYLHFSPEGRLFGVLVKHGNLLAIDDFEVMQFTGMRDAEEREVYEGDILRYPSNVLVRVYWSSASFKISDGTFRFPLENNLSTAQVIGNIWEHPERLPAVVHRQIREDES